MESKTTLEVRPGLNWQALSVVVDGRVTFSASLWGKVKEMAATETRNGETKYHVIIGDCEGFLHDLDEVKFADWPMQNSDLQGVIDCKEFAALRGIEHCAVRP